MIFGFNGQIGCVPFSTKGIETKSVGGLAIISQKTELTKLRVIYGDSEKTIIAGDCVFLNSSDFNTKFGTNVYSIDGQEFILVPLAQVRMVSKEGY